MQMWQYKKRTTNKGSPLFILCFLLLELGVGIKVGRLDILEITVCADFKFCACVFIGHDDCMWMKLQCGNCPHLADAALYAVAECAGFVVSVDQQHHGAGCHYSADAYGEGCLGHKVEVAFEEARVGYDSVLSQGLHAGLGAEG